MTIQDLSKDIVLAKKAGGALLKDVEHLASYEPERRGMLASREPEARTANEWDGIEDNSLNVVGSSKHCKEN